MKAYTVFNVEQIDGLPAHYYVRPEPIIAPGQRIDHAEGFFAATGATIRHGGNQAYYSGGTDHVQMPVFESFPSPEAYYATFAHELTHWTKHPKRLDRNFGRQRWGDEIAPACGVSHEQHHHRNNKARNKSGMRK